VNKTEKIYHIKDLKKWGIENPPLLFILGVIIIGIEMKMREI